MQDLNGGRLFSTADHCHVPAEAWRGSPDTGTQQQTINSLTVFLYLQLLHVKKTKNKQTKKHPNGDAS